MLLLYSKVRGLLNPYPSNIIVSIQLHTSAYVSIRQVFYITHNCNTKTERARVYARKRERRANICFEGCGLSMLILFPMSAACTEV